MIVDIWGVKTTRRNNKRKSLYCFKADKYKVLEKKLTGYIVKYKCDNDMCLYPDKINITGTSSLFRSKWNNIEHQLCRSCRTIKSEKEVKKTVITYDKMKEFFNSLGYILITSKEEIKNCKYPSQYKLKYKCNKGHKSITIWNNIYNQNKRCRKCYDEQRELEAVNNKKGFDLYFYNVNKETKKSYKKYKHIINPDNLKRRRNNYHLDHKYSISQGFKNNIDSKIIGSYVNLKIITEHDNCSKCDKCSITKEELFNEYNKKIRFI